MEQNDYITPPCSGVPNNGDKITTSYITPTFLGGRNGAEWQDNPCLSGGAPTMGTRSEVATSPLPSWGPRIGRNRYVTPVCSGVPNKGGKITRGYITRAFSGVRNCVEWLNNPCVLRGHQQWEQNEKWLRRPYLLRGLGVRNGNITPAFSGGPQQWGQDPKWLYHSCLLGGQELRGMAA